MSQALAGQKSNLSFMPCCASYQRIIGHEVNIQYALSPKDLRNYKYTMLSLICYPLMFLALFPVLLSSSRCHDHCSHSHLTVVSFLYKLIHCIFSVLTH